jgi:virginiamycin B lyase
VIAEYAIGTSNAHPRGIVTGPDGAIWFAEFLGNKIGRLR